MNGDNSIFHSRILSSELIYIRTGIQLRLDALEKNLNKIFTIIKLKMKA